MSLISTEEKIELLKNLLTDPNDWISREILYLVDRFEQDQQQPSIASLPKAINSSIVKTVSQSKYRFKCQKINQPLDSLIIELKDFQ